MGACEAPRQTPGSQSEIDALVFEVLESERLRVELIERHSQPMASTAPMMIGKL